MNQEKIKSRLVIEFGYAESGATLVSTQLMNLTTDIRKAFESYWSSNVIPDLELEGYSLKGLMKEI